MPQVRTLSRLGALGLLLPPMPARLARSQLGSTEFPTFDPTYGTTTWVASACREAEAAGASGIWASDHLFWHRPALEALTTLAVAAVSTRAAVVGTCVLQLPLRNAAAVAKASSSLQLLSEGRFVLGDGVGSHAVEHELATSDYATRGARLDDGIDDMRRLWGNAGSPRGYRLEPALPAPVWVGGSSPAAIRRAASRGDGWVPLFVSPERFRANLATLRDEAAAMGREPGEITPAVVMVAAVGRRGTSDRLTRADGLSWLADLYRLPAKAFERHLVAGSPEHCAETVAAYREAGAAHVVVMIAGDRALPAFAALAGAVGASEPSALTFAGAIP